MNIVLRKLQVSPENAGLLNTMYFSFFASGLMCTLMGTLLPFMKAEYNLSYVLSGAVLSAHQAGNLCAVLIAGFLPYAIGRKKSTVFLCTGMVIGFVLITCTGNPVVLIAAFAAAGVGKGTLSNITNVVVSSVTENKTAGLNILHAVFAVGALTAPAVAILTVKYLPPAWGWRAASWIFVACVCAALFRLQRSALSDKPTPKPQKGGVPFVRSPSFWLNTGILFFYLCCESAVVGWLVTYFRDSGIMSTALSQSTASLLWIMMMTGRIVCAALPASVDKPRLIALFAVLQICFFALMLSSTHIVPVMIGLLGVGFGMSVIFPTTLATMDPRFNASTVATGTCIAAATAGAVLMPVLVGIVAEYAGITGGISVIGIAYGCMLCLALIKLVISERKKRIHSRGDAI